MGYQLGKGLGRFGTGITQPVEESVQKGRHGLGYLLKGLEKEEVQWEEEEVRFSSVILTSPSSLIRASLSEPRMINTMRKSPVPMFVCMCVCIYACLWQYVRLPRVHHASAFDALC